MKAFNHVADSISKIYQNLSEYKKIKGQANLILENTNEPYLEGITYTAKPPQKRFRGINMLSGGEQTLAALALLFAIQTYRKAPFFILDEIDAALDNRNSGKVARYIKDLTTNTDFQCIVISLKDNFYEKANALIGVARDHSSSSSKTFTLDLSPYQSSNSKSLLSDTTLAEDKDLSTAVV